MFCGLMLDMDIYKAYFGSQRIKTGRRDVIVTSVITSNFESKLCEGPFVGVEEKVQVSHQF
jgi:hypothetical protein